MPFSADIMSRLAQRLERLYGDRGAETLQRLTSVMDRAATGLTVDSRPWSERDVVLITYGDQVRRDGLTPLSALHGFLTDHGLDRLLETVHILPFYPYSSDDGFSVIDYRAVDPALGSWEDIERLGRDFRLMFDLVLNHASTRSAWFDAWRAGTEPYTRFFVETDPAVDLGLVRRPRSGPLLTPFETNRGQRHVWTTFSDDQADLDFSNPDVLLEIIDILLLYVAEGAHIVRLDAIAYLWKRVGTTCIHLEETHEIVKLMRDVVDVVAPGTIILTETNVPHEENIRYFGDADEAQMVYQFSLAPLLLEALRTGNAGPLARWIASLGDDAPPGCTFFNFTASHDGIGVTPLKGLLSESRFSALLDDVRALGGQVSTRATPTGELPYEMNIAYVSALDEVSGLSDALAVRRFLTSQAVMLAMAGMPGVYFHSLVGTPNDVDAVTASGRARSINRRKYDADDLSTLLSDPTSRQGRIFAGYQRMLEIRRAQPAFHPEGAQHPVAVDDPAVVAFLRTSPDSSQRILVLANTAGTDRSPSVSIETGRRIGHDLLDGHELTGPAIPLAPWQCRWVALGA